MITFKLGFIEYRVFFVCVDFSIISGRRKHDIYNEQKRVNGRDSTYERTVIHNVIYFCKIWFDLLEALTARYGVDVLNVEKEVIYQLLTKWHKETQ